MKKLLLLGFALTFAATTGTSFAGSGTFGFGIELDGTGALATNNGVNTLYALDNATSNRLQPVPSSATVSTAWTNASTSATPTFNLGTFNINTGSTDSLILKGGSLLSFKNGGSDVTGATLEYQIFSVSPSGTFTAVNLPFGADNVAGNTGDQRWDTESLSINLLAGLNTGTYVLDVYGLASSTDGTHYETGGSINNYGATFTVVPEPSTWAMMLGGLGMLVCFQRLRRKPVA